MDNVENDGPAANFNGPMPRSSVRVSSACAVPFARLCDNNVTVVAKETDFGARAASTSRLCPSRISKFLHNSRTVSHAAPPTMLDRDATVLITRSSMAENSRASPFRDFVPGLESGWPRQRPLALALA